LAAAKELKTKPSQHSIKTLMESGIKADILVCRTEHELSDDIRQKLALFCNVKREAVIQSIDASTIYDVPMMMLEEKLDLVALKKLGLKSEITPDLSSWQNFLTKLKNPKRTITVGLVGKYVELQDSYKSILEAFIHAGAENETKVVIKSIHSEGISEDNVKERLAEVDGVLVAPGFGSRGIEGKIATIKYVRENKIPFFGICLGMQMAVIEFARNVLGFEEANSSEMDPDTKVSVIDLMADQKNITHMGGTMRLGNWDCQVKEGTLAHQIYQSKLITERHRHRYEYDNKYRKILEENGLITSGVNPATNLVEIVEIKDHPFFIGVQFHPEYKSTVDNPHPLFVSFIKAIVNQKK
jgi:CTP synthase